MKQAESVPEEDLQEDAVEEQEADIDDGTDNVGDASVEINVEELIIKLEVDGVTKQLDREAQTRRRLEELMEQRRARRELEDLNPQDRLSPPPAPGSP